MCPEIDHGWVIFLMNHREKVEKHPSSEGIGLEFYGTSLAIFVPQWWKYSDKVRMMLGINIIEHMQKYAKTTYAEWCNK